MNILSNYSTLSDRRLVELHLAGDRTAFRQIVERYQAMVCALGLSSCGDVGRSEDLAQEVFVAAWRQLGALREPDKLRGWLAGIARNLAHNSFRRESHTPTARPEPLSLETPAAGESPRERAVHTDEAALMWSALEGIPENYREPMVLFYREHHSVTAVAATLELSEETVRQRLARGRAMLTERMAALVEETLERSAPAPTFALTVLMALPFGAAPTVIESTIGAGGGAVAKATSAAGAVGAAAAKGGLALKLVSGFAVLPALLNGVTDYLRFRAHYEAPAVGSRRAAITARLWPLVFNAAILSGAAFGYWSPFRGSYWPALNMIPLLAALIATAVFARRNRGRCDALGASIIAAPPFEYRSPGGWLGLPWIHVSTGGRGSYRRVARGWVAISDGLALGGFFANGPLAVAPVSIGGIAVGLFALGGLAFGLASLGVIALGGWAVGGFAAAWQGAQGGWVLAHEFASGFVAQAPHVHDATAGAFFDSHHFFGWANTAARVLVWAGFFGWVPALLLIGWHLRSARRRT